VQTILKFVFLCILVSFISKLS